nr:MAG TPA: hypothetical protein [Caudoviricetes sp.]
MVKKINENLMDAGRLTSIDFVVIHNDDQEKRNKNG